MLQNLVELLKHLNDKLLVGGPVVILLGLMSIVAITIIVAKLMQFRAAGISDFRAAREALSLYRTGNAPSALAATRRSRSPVARVARRTLELKERQNLSEPRMREEIMQYGADILEQLRSHLRTLEVIASLAPLLGLFGTVLGMIEAFQALQAAGNQVNPALLSGGIWQALLTTAVGLGVAMPVMVALSWFERLVDRQAQEMDSIVTRIFILDPSQADTEAELDTDDTFVYRRPVI
ncbi:MotA/TolQ/ExbB proton channel family protein [Salinisphaera hydrothermalis]|uniref:MotA/TolQ/ExbB proton channel family protein n=1 Tax=Salinisphaera hydrothermalis (strain C41B8) TaxID=1304275 RepID=A0A084INT4_SALHC|nr:MotA/TolQ/ExbB proton channel family protein [Salinisphaera hydrothermalis]KEZ78368.1 MotA/TolQ/ExbB proton channel family protein [Salinisphaera hydrothermalis C41B8]